GATATKREPGSHSDVHRPRAPPNEIQPIGWCIVDAPVAYAATQGSNTRGSVTCRRSSPESVGVTSPPGGAVAVSISAAPSADREMVASVADDSAKLRPLTRPSPATASVPAGSQGVTLPS